jgi:hypothetical protein
LTRLVGEWRPRRPQRKKSAPCMPTKLHATRTCSPNKQQDWLDVKVLAPAVWQRVSAYLPPKPNRHTPWYYNGTTCTPPASCSFCWPALFLPRHRSVGTCCSTLSVFLCCMASKSSASCRCWWRGPLQAAALHEPRGEFRAHYDACQLCLVQQSFLLPLGFGSRHDHLLASATDEPPCKLSQSTISSAQAGEQAWTRARPSETNDDSVLCTRPGSASPAVAGMALAKSPCPRVERGRRP